MNEFLILIKGGHDKHDSMSNDERNAYYQKWGAFLERLKSQKVFIGGAPLARSGKVVERSSDNHRDWKLDAEKSVGGYLLVKADSLDAVAKTIKECPIFITGGSVEIRPLESM